MEHTLDKLLSFCLETTAIHETARKQESTKEVEIMQLLLCGLLKTKQTFFRKCTLRKFGIFPNRSLKREILFLYI